MNKLLFLDFFFLNLKFKGIKLYSSPKYLFKVSFVKRFGSNPIFIFFFKIFLGQT